MDGALNPKDGDSSASVDVRTLRRALDVHGTLEKLASLLGVSVAKLTTWIEGRATPPYEVFLAALNSTFRHVETKTPTDPK